MAKVRQARRCRAHRRNGAACRAYAITGGYVCRVHGGASPLARAAADRRRIRDSVERAVRDARRRRQRELMAWQANRIRTAARLLGVPNDEVTIGHIIWCHLEYGVPPLDDRAPQLRFDRRYGRRPRWT